MDLQTAARTARQLGNTALARRARSYPSPEFARDGYVVRPDFLAPGRAATIRADLDRFADPAVTGTGVDGAGLRDRANRQTRDLHVRQLTNADRLSPELAALAGSGDVERILGALTGRRLAVGGTTVQIDWPDTETKRGLHVDSHWPPTYKAFVYLTPVTSPANGPFSVVPGSHRDRLKKVRAIAGDVAAHRDHTDLDHVYDLADARCLLGDAGTAIFADQRLAHAGWPGHTTGTRFMIVFYVYEEGVTPPGFLGRR
jgi:hypothetical protein